MKEVIEKFLIGWVKNDFKTMYGLCQKTWVSKHSLSIFKNTVIGRIKGYTIIEIKYDEKIPCVADVLVDVRIAGVVKHLSIRILKEKEPYKPDIDGTWGINPLSLIRNLY